MPRDADQLWELSRCMPGVLGGGGRGEGEGGDARQGTARRGALLLHGANPLRSKQRRCSGNAGTRFGALQGGVLRLAGGLFVPSYRTYEPAPVTAILCITGRAACGAPPCVRSPTATRCDRKSVPHLARRPVRPLYPNYRRVVTSCPFIRSCLRHGPVSRSRAVSLSVCTSVVVTCSSETTRCGGLRT